MHSTHYFLIIIVAYYIVSDTSHIWDNPFDGMIRLTRGNYHTEGLLEVYCGDQWGTVCDDTFGTTAGVASCRQLGYQINDQYDHLPL